MFLMSNSYVSNLDKPTIIYKGEEDEMVKYLTQLWNSNTENTFSEINNSYGLLPENINLQKFKSELSRVSDNLVFRGNFGAYSDKLEKNISLTKKSIVLNKDNCKNLYLCMNDFIKYNSIRPELFDKIKYADIFVKHKNGNNTEPKNFRFLSNQSNVFKIIDKFWTNNLIRILENNNSLPDKKIVRNTLSRKYSVSIRDLAVEKLNKFLQGKNIVLLDIKKAFDNVSWKSLNKLLISNLSRKINPEIAKKVTSQYMFLNTNRIIKYNEKMINFSKSLATGLPSSTLVFSLMIEQIIYEWKLKENIGENLIINTFVDDLYLEFNCTDKSLEHINSLIAYLESYDLIINKEKTKTNIVHLPFSQIDKSDCYLGLPFCSNKKDYILECINLFQEKYYKLNIKQLIDIVEDDSSKVKKEIIGFFNYKLYGLLNFDFKEIDVLEILKFYEKKYK